MSSDTQIAEIILAIKALTAKVDNLTVEKIIKTPADEYPRVSTNSLTMLTEEKRDAIYACPKVSEVSYNPPSLKDSSSNAGTLPIDFFIHKHLQADPNLTLDGHVVEILNTVRCIMGNVATIATQSRLENQHKRINFTGKPEKVVESDVKPLVDSKKIDA
ncbi:hypothetical protein AYI68_g2721 [Smittium mucronatum]|uniref:Uncharacterized protein n=1 Tax=Smittium mucronatum TaxID=133383 RepID=A0A1R0H1X5_9FUNG|nr:hypothetical protein AYI68_g2721 [Smittium mucronatum]